MDFNKKVIFNTELVEDKITTFLIRIILLIVLFIALWNIGQNPIFMTIFATLLLIGFLSYGHFKILVYEDKFSYKSGSILKSFWVNKNFYYDDLKEVASSGNFDSEADLFPTENILNQSMPFNKIIITNKFDQQDVFETRINSLKLKEAVKYINERIKPSKKFDR